MGLQRDLTPASTHWVNIYLGHFCFSTSVITLSALHEVAMRTRYVRRWPETGHWEQYLILPLCVKSHKVEVCWDERQMCTMCSLRWIHMQQLSHGEEGECSKSAVACSYFYWGNYFKIEINCSKKKKKKKECCIFITHNLFLFSVFYLSFNN